MATRFSILAWKIAWIEELSRLQCMHCKESDRIEHMPTRTHAHTHTHTHARRCCYTCLRSTTKVLTPAVLSYPPSIPTLVVGVLRVVVVTPHLPSPAPLPTLQTKLALCAKSLQSYPTLCNPMDCNLPGSSVHGILQASILECVALLQEVFPTPGSNPCLLWLLHWQVGSLPLVPGGLFLTSSASCWVLSHS